MKNNAIIGLICLYLIISGCLFKIMYWPSANIQLTLGLLGISLIYLPMMLFQKWQKKEISTLFMIAMGTTFSLSIFSMWMKILHLPYADIILNLGYTLPFIFFLPVYLYEQRNAERNANIEQIGVFGALAFIAVFSVLLVTQ